MPFGLSHTRSKSRSPAPGSANVLPQYTRPPTFLPPSHYAAAAGLEYKNHDFQQPMNVAQHPAEGPPGDCAGSHFGAVGRLIGRSPGKRLPAISTSPESRVEEERDFRERRKSQLGDIPLLETQLLPSLRDTVDRMTQPPPLKAEAPEMVDASHTRTVRSRRRRDEVAPSLSASSSIATKMGGLWGSSPSTGIPRFNPMSPPAPKSALKSPGRRTVAANPPTSASSQRYRNIRFQNSESSNELLSGSDAGSEVCSPRYSSRSVKPSASIPSRPASKATSSLPRPHPEAKSRSNPGTPQPPRRAAVFATPQPNRPSVSPLPQSSLPRPKSRYTPVPPSDSGLELERRVSLKHSPGRLVVTNAVIVPSSSESDHSTKSRNRRSQWIRPQDALVDLPPDIPVGAPPTESTIRSSRDPSAASRGQLKTTVGLGLNVNGLDYGRGTKHDASRDDESVYDDELSDHSLLAEEPVLAADSGDDDESIYDDEPSPRRMHSLRSHVDDLERERRQEEAILGLVDGLHRDYRRASGAGARVSVARSEAPAESNMQGFAVCDPRDLQDEDVVSSRPPSQRPNSRVSQASQYSPVSQWDQESTYSDDGNVDGHHALGTRYDNSQDQRRSPQPREDIHAGRTTDRSASSLRQSRVSWKRPSSSLGIHDPRRDDFHDEARPSPATLGVGSHRRSVSPMSASASPRPHSPLPARGPSQSASPPLDTPSPTPSPASRSRSRTLDSHSRDSHSASGIKKPQRTRAKSLSSRSERPVETHLNQGESLAAPGRGDRVPSGSPRVNSRQVEDPGARERLAFGIPESLSYPGSNLTPDEQDSIRPPLSRIGSAESARPRLPRADSDLSVADSAWEEPRLSKEFSSGAAALFETLASSAVNSRSARQETQRRLQYGDDQDKTPQAEPASWIPPASKSSSRSQSRSRSQSQSQSQSQSRARSRSRSRSPLPQSSKGAASYDHTRRRSFDSVSAASCSSAESIYDEPPGPARGPAVQRSTTPPVQHAETESPGSWRHSMPRDVYRSLSKQYGPTEMERQELIYSLFNSEKTFVLSARHVIRTYFLPLRARDSRTWLPGLPADVARLFDWLEDIVNLHVAVVRALAGVIALWKTGAIVSRVGGTLRAFVPQLEIYMPYLVRLDSVRETLRWHAEKDRGELGEYLRMRERDRVEGEWALDKLLEEPVARLAKYIDIYQRLCELTPKEHPDHLAALSLLYATRMALRVIEEVKAREEEYDFIKDLASRIDGLSDNIPLARRARRLLWYGTLLQPDAASDRPAMPASTIHDTPVKKPTLRTPQTPDAGTLRYQQPNQRMSRLVTAVRNWDARRTRSGSLSSSASSTLSVRTCDTTTSSSSASVLATPKSDRYGGFVPGSATKKALKAGGARDPRDDTGYLKERSAPTLNVMVFTDVVVLAIPKLGGDNAPDTEQRCHLMETTGLSRILAVMEGEKGTVTLDLIPIGPEYLDSGLVGEDTSVISITLGLPQEGDTHEQLFGALRKCQQHTVRSLSFPAPPGSMMEDLEIDTRQSLVGILSSGLPLPKSPSIQFDEAAKGQRRDAVDGEREERGWWTLRFQQVLRELQREEVSSSMLVANTASGKEAR